MENTEPTEVVPKKRSRRRGEKVYNPNRNPVVIQHPFDFPDDYLLETYNLNRAAIQELLFVLGPHIGSSTGSSYMTERKLAVALYFYRTGGPIKHIGDSLNLNFHACNFVLGVQEVTTQMDKYAVDLFIDFPNTIQQKETVKQRFLMTTGLNDVMGSIDCFHVRISKPSYQLDANEYLSDFGFYSKHVQIICDYDMNILGCFARYGGSDDETSIWQKSVVRKYMNKLHEENDQNFLIAGPNYPEEPWLLTPVYDDSIQDENFNKAHEMAHLPVRRLIAMLREEFECLSARGLHLHPGYAGAVINCCCALHNLRRKHNLPMPDVIDENLIALETAYKENARRSILFGRNRRTKNKKTPDKPTA